MLADPQLQALQALQRYNGENRMKISPGVGLTIALLAAMPSQAATKPQSMAVTGKAIVTRMDRDGDGKIGSEEFRNAMMRRFASADADGDGVLKGDEVPQHSVTMQKSTDTAGDVTLEAFSGSLQQVFGTFDTNKDGLLEGDEIEAFAQARRDLKEAKP